MACADDSVMVMIQEVATKPSSARTKIFPRQNGSNRLSIAIEPCPWGLSLATRRYIGNTSSGVSATITVWRSARPRRRRGRRSREDTTAWRSSRRPSGTSPSTRNAAGPSTPRLPGRRAAPCAGRAIARAASWGDRLEAGDARRESKSVQSRMCKLLLQDLGGRYVIAPAMQHPSGCRGADPHGFLTPTHPIATRPYGSTTCDSRIAGGAESVGRRAESEAYSASRCSMVCSITRSNAPGPTEMEPWYGWSMSAVTNITKPMNRASRPAMIRCSRRLFT